MSNVSDQVAKTVENAKEAAEKLGEQVSDFFQGNPFSTAVGMKIEQATDASHLATENWGLNMEICDYINSSEEMAKDAVRAIRKRLHTSMSKNNAVVMYTLTVLETCVKNCRHHFHVLICSKDFVLDLVKLIGAKFDAPQIIQERVLSLIQAWTDAFKNEPDLQGVRQVYEDLKSKGVEFPAANLDTLAPILTPKKTVYTPHAQIGPQISSANHYSRQNVQMVEATDGQPVMATPEQLTKLRKDLDVVNANLKVFRDMLMQVTPGKETADELQLLGELHDSCKQMQRRVLDLIRTVQNEEVTSELLVVNDDFNSVFEKYERFITNRAGENSSAPVDSSLIELEGQNKPLSEQLAHMKVNPATTSDAYAAQSEGQASVGLATAVSHKASIKESTESESKQLPTDTEVKEMENWLGAQESAPPKTSSDLENDKL